MEQPSTKTDKPHAVKEPQTNAIGVSDDIRWAHHAENQDVLIRKCANFIVYLDRGLEIDWESTQAYDEELQAEKIDVGKIQGVITCLEAIPVDHLPKPIKRAFRAILGEAMCMALDKRMPSAQKLLSKAEEFVAARNHEHARWWYVCGSIWSVVASFALTAIVAWIYLLNYPNSTNAKFNILAVGFGGGAGALLSILLRIGKASLDPAAGSAVHYLESAGRILVGIIGAVVVLSAIRAKLILPQLSNPYGLVLACVIAGTSEKLAHTIVERVERAVNGGEKQHTIPSSKPNKEKE